MKETEMEEKCELIFLKPQFSHLCFKVPGLKMQYK